MAKNKQTKADAQRIVDRARALHALSCLMQLIVTARAQAGIVTWQKVGGLEAEEFLDAVESGRQRPLITEWKRKAANRHGPGLRQRRFQRLAVLLSVALQRGGTDKKAARRQAAALLAEVLAQPISRRAVEHWELESDLPLCAEEEAVIKAALARGSDPASVVRHFRGLIKFPNLLDSREALTVLGNPPMLEN